MDQITSLCNYDARNRDIFCLGSKRMANSGDISSQPSSFDEATEHCLLAAKENYIIG
jgi:hypothetical protein